MIREDLKRQIEEIKEKLKNCNPEDEKKYREMLDYLESMLEELDMYD